MYEHLEMEYEDIVKMHLDDVLFEEYYLAEEEDYSYSPNWSDQNYYVEYWDSE